jgi:hypothetical protein
VRTDGSVVAPSAGFLKPESFRPGRDSSCIKKSSAGVSPAFWGSRSHRRPVGYSWSSLPGLAQALRRCGVGLE